MRSLKRIAGISWKEKFTNSQVLTKAGIPSIHTLLCQRRLRWIGHVHRMEDGRIRKDLFYGELADGKRNVGRPKLLFKDVCKRNMKACNINPNTWETFATDCLKWKCVTSHGLKYGESEFHAALETKRNKRKASVSDTNRNDDNLTPIFTCQICARVCKSRIGLNSHVRRCSRNSQDATPKSED